MSTEPELELPEGEEPMPRGTHAMAIVRWSLLAAMAVLAVFAWTSFARSGAKDTSTISAKKIRYRCPMHPQVVQDEPGECPICHMTLEPFEVGPMPAAGNDAGHHRATTPGANRPDAGPEPEPGSVPAGTTPIQLSFDRVQSIGVRTALATTHEMSHTTRVTAVVEAPEQGASEVHVRTPGFVESIAVNQTGVAVSVGQPLFSFYSPAIFETEQEVLALGKWTDGGDSMSTTARTKLELLGVSAADSDEIGRTGKAKRAVAVVAPKNGYVVKKSITLGSYVTPEMVLYELQDLSRVYVVASVFQKDRDVAIVGASGTFHPSSRAPDESIVGKVDLVYPNVGADARTTRVRMQVDNPGRKLLPGDYGVVEFAARTATTTTTTTMTMVPRDAVVSTGRQTYVFVDEGSGRFTPKIVVLGSEDGDRVSIEAGLSPGERVVSGATFLLDSESRLQASVSAQAAQSAAASACDVDFDRTKYPDKWSDCQKCEQAHAGMGSMVTDCKNAIPKPWR